MSAHTKEEWLIVGNTIYSLQPCGWKKGVEQFENRFRAHVQGHKCPDEELHANAVLMAAAPELLEALVLLEREMIASGNAGSEDYGWKPAIEKTRAAIAKAKGSAS